MAIKELEMTWGERLRTEGALNAKREVLLDLIRTRFGAVPDALAAQVAQADETWLTQMLRRAATASSLEELTSQ